MAVCDRKQGRNTSPWDLSTDQLEGISSRSDPFIGCLSGRSNVVSTDAALLRGLQFEHVDLCGWNRAKADPSQNMSYSTRDAIESPKTQAMCEQLQKKWPSLLGDGPAGCSWEWGTPRPGTD